jgi:hypothetical protein
LKIGFDAAGLDTPATPIVNRGVGQNQIVELTNSVGGLVAMGTEAIISGEAPMEPLEMVEGIADVAEIATGLSVRNVLDELVGMGYTIEGEEGGIRRMLGTSEFTIEQDKDKKSSKSKVKFTGV